MYDSSKTKLIKLVFDNASVVTLFIDLTMELQGKHNLDKFFPAQLEKIYLQYKKIFRDKFFKKFCEQYNLLNDKRGIEFENKEIVNILKENMITGIKIFAQDFTNNRLLEERLQKSLKLVCHNSAQQTISLIANNPTILLVAKAESAKHSTTDISIVERDLVTDRA